MVVVAITSLLALVATPKFEEFTLRARNSEAKSNLSALYMAEQAYRAEQQMYTSTFDVLGFQPVGRLWSNIGFDEEQAPNPTGPQGNDACRMLCPRDFCGNYAKWSCSTSSNNGLDGAHNAMIGFTTFRAGSHAHYSDRAKDWVSFTIDQDKRLQQIIPGN